MFIPIIELGKMFIYDKTTIKYKVYNINNGQKSIF